MLHTNVLEKIKTHILCPITFFFFLENRAVMKQCRKYNRVGEATDESMAHARFTLNT